MIGAGRSQFSKKLKIIVAEQIGSCSEVCSRTLQKFIFFFQNQFQVVLLLQCVFLNNVLYIFINALLYKPEKIRSVNVITIRNEMIAVPYCISS